MDLVIHRILCDFGALSLYVLWRQYLAYWQSCLSNMAENYIHFMHNKCFSTYYISWSLHHGCLKFCGPKSAVLHAVKIVPMVGKCPPYDWSCPSIFYTEELGLNPTNGMGDFPPFLPPSRGPWIGWRNDLVGGIPPIQRVLLFLFSFLFFCTKYMSAT